MTAKKEDDSKTKTAGAKSEERYTAGAQMFLDGAPFPSNSEEFAGWLNELADTVRLIAALQRAQLGQGTEEDPEAHTLLRSLMGVAFEEAPDKG